jgi:hypothetical protein
MGVESWNGSYAAKSGFLWPKKVQKTPRGGFPTCSSNFENIDFLTLFKAFLGAKKAIFGPKSRFFRNGQWSGETGPTQPNPGFYGLKKCKRHPGVVFRPVRAISKISIF